MRFDRKIATSLKLNARSGNPPDESGRGLGQVAWFKLPLNGQPSLFLSILFLICVLKAY